MAYADYVGEMVGTFPRLSSVHAGQLVNRAWRRIRDYRLWSFHVISGAQQFVPPAVTAGRAIVTQYANTIVMDTAGAAAMDAIAFGNPPLANPVLGIGRQIQITAGNGLNAPNGPYYSIQTWDSPNKTLTIDRPYGESSGSFTYQVSKVYYTPPMIASNGIMPASADANFIKYLSITNKQQGYSVTGRRLYYTQQMLDAYDPQRGGTGDAYIIASLGKSASGQPVHEWYPNPVNGATYYCTYLQRWLDLSPSIDLPQMPYELSDCVIQLAKMEGAGWALANCGTMPELQSVNWVAYRENQKGEFREALIQCIKVDDEIAPLREVKQGSTWADFPLGGVFLQSHDLSPLIP